MGSRVDYEWIGEDFNKSSKSNKTQPEDGGIYGTFFSCYLTVEDWEYGGSDR
jgi:hypothetical protein